MTLATGRPNNVPGRIASRRRAFSLIEMILVMALLVVAVSMVSPRLSGFIRGRALESEARRVLALTHAARSRAVSESLPVLLWLDSATGHYGIERDKVHDAKSDATATAQLLMHLIKELGVETPDQVSELFAP